MRGFVELRQAAACSFISAWQCVYPKNRLCLGEEGDEARLRPRDVVMRGVAAEFPVLARGHASFSTSGMLSAARAVRVRPTGLTVSPAGSGTRTSLARRLQSLHVDAYAVRQFRRRHGAASSDDRAECVVVRHLPAQRQRERRRLARVERIVRDARPQDHGIGQGRTGCDAEGERMAGRVRRGVQQGRGGAVDAAASRAAFNRNRRRGQVRENARATWALTARSAIRAAAAGAACGPGRWRRRSALLPSP